MNAISFGRVNVQNHGIPVKFGQSTLNGALAIGSESLVVTSAAPFCSDMCPFKMQIEQELVMVKSISGGVTFSVQRAIDGTSQTAHISGSQVSAQFKLAGWRVGQVSGLTGRAYWGTSDLVASTGVGVIKEFGIPHASATVGATEDFFDFMPADDKGNPLTLTDYAMDVTVDNEGLFVTAWQR